MRGSVTAAFSEPEDFEAALRSEGCLSLVVTGPGQFQARLTQITLQSFRLLAGDERLSRIAFIAVPAGMVLISFPIGNGSLPVYGGLQMRIGEIMTLSPGEHIHARTEGERHWGVVLLPMAELIEYGCALTGAPFSIPPVAQRWRPPPAAGRELRNLHVAATRMAVIRPQVVADAQAVRALEQQLILAIVHCLSAGPADVGGSAARRHQDIMARFERLLQTQCDRDMRVTEICAALGVSQRLLRSLCVEHLGMSPITYDRRRRLSLARRALRHNGAETATVAEIARRAPISCVDHQVHRADHRLRGKRLDRPARRIPRQCGAIARTPHAGRLLSLSPSLQHAAVELLRGTMAKHNFIAYRDDRLGESQPITFDGNAWREYVPLRLPWTLCIRDRVPSGSVAVLINRAHTYPDLALPIGPAQHRIYAAIDGNRSIAEILRTAAGPGSDEQARRVIEQLWEYDQIVFDATGPRLSLAPAGTRCGHRRISAAEKRKKTKRSVQ